MHPSPARKVLGMLPPQSHAGESRARRSSLGLRFGSVVMRADCVGRAIGLLDSPPHCVPLIGSNSPLLSPRTTPLAAIKSSDPARLRRSAQTPPEATTTPLIDARSEQRLHAVSETEPAPPNASVSSATPMARATPVPAETTAGVGGYRGAHHGECTAACLTH